MDRPQRRWVRTLAVVAGGTAGAIALFAMPASASGATTGTVAAEDGLMLRTAPTRSAVAKGSLPNGTNIAIVCQVTGEPIAGNVRQTDLWNRLANGWYVSDAYVTRAGTPQSCAEADQVKPIGGSVPVSPDTLVTGSAAAARAKVGDNPVARWMAPLAETVGSGFRTPDRPTHDGVDLAAPRNTPIQAPASGTVITVVCNTSNGSCDIDGSPAVQGCGWYLEIQHTNQVVTRYCHLSRRPTVAVGQQVTAGQVIGLVGSSGNSSGPHLHFEVHTRAPATHTNAIDPVAFMKRVGVDLS